MKGWHITVLAIAAISLLPIWRIAGSKEGYNVWELLEMKQGGFFTPVSSHIPAEEAVRLYEKTL